MYIYIYVYICIYVEPYTYIYEYTEVHIHYIATWRLRDCTLLVQVWGECSRQSTAPYQKAEPPGSRLHLATAPCMERLQRLVCFGESSGNLMTGIPATLKDAPPEGRNSTCPYVYRRV